MTDILYVAWNRLAFTQESFRALLANTPWAQIGALHIHDDRSDDGTGRWLVDAQDAVPEHVQVRYESMELRSPVEIMNRFLSLPGGEWFAKIDNDACVPPGWLDALLEVRDTSGADLIGMEAGMTAVAGRNEPWDGRYRLEPCSHIGGMGLMRRAAFTRAMPANGRYGFGDYQRQARLERGWITPDLPLILLDRLPFEPWVSLSAEYEAAGWQRPWPKWDETWMAWAWEWLFPDETEEAA